MYTDTHCHLSHLDEPSDQVVARARAAGVTTIVTVGTDIESSQRCVDLARAHDGVVAAVGIHPNDATQATPEALDRLAALAGDPAVVAIGETGLDWYRDWCPRDRQEESFRAHIRLAKLLDKTLVIHDRDAHDDVVRVLRDEGAPARTVFHCFSGGNDLVQTCATHGWYLSFAGNVTFANAAPLRAAAAAAPLDLLVAETDAPFLTPHPHRGKPNEPARVVHTVALLAELHGRSPEDMAALTSANARRLFALPA